MLYNTTHPGNNSIHAEPDVTLHTPFKNTCTGMSNFKSDYNAQLHQINIIKRMQWEKGGKNRVGMWSDIG